VPSATLEDVDDVAFGNVQARMLRIGNPVNGWTNYGEVNMYGLSEVRLYGTAAGAPACYRLSNITATASSEGVGWGRYATNAVCALGLLADADGDGIPPHDTDTSHMWMCQPTQPNVSNQWIQFQFSEAVALDHMRVWNWNNTESAGAEYELQHARIRYSMDGATWSTLADPAYFTMSLGVSIYEAADEFSFGGVQAQYVRLDNLRNFKSDNSDGVGLSKVWFYARNPFFGGTVFRFH
jgi:hypothetical protein